MKFRVRPGKTFGASGQYTEGMLIDLSEEEAKAFSDKLEPVLDESVMLEVPQVRYTIPESDEPETLMVAKPKRKKKE